MSKFTDELRKRHEAQEERRIGDIYAECERRGCKHYLLTAFNARAENYPLKQARAFLELEERSGGMKDKIRQYAIYIQVLIEKRPESGMIHEWEETLKLLKSNGY